ncbi:MAG: hypothetical protein EPO16_04000 [Dehalococcoidia bacterium]|nr:MAG: hypothetical protein EPO16_04000 [Dehalococcoidia bacterium]
MLKIWEMAWQPRTAYGATGADRLENAPQDAGWAHLVNVEGTVDLGRGHLKLWMEAPGGATLSGRQAQLESFTPTGHPLRAGDRVSVRPEAETAAFPATVRRYEEDGSNVVLLNWTEDDALPAMLLETGGERSGEGSTTTAS